MAPFAVILDVDGTLVNSNDAHAQAWVDAFNEAGIDVSYDRVRRAIGMGGDKLMPHVAGIRDDSREGSRISKRRGEIFREHHLPHLSAFPLVRDLVRQFITDGYTVVVASSAQSDELSQLLKIAGVSDLIAATASSSEASRSKPDPDIVQAALQRSGAPAEQAIMLGDTPYDVEAALRAGIADRRRRVGRLECGGSARRGGSPSRGRRDLRALRRVGVRAIDTGRPPHFTYFLNTASNDAGRAVRSRAQRSGIDANRCGAVAIVKSCGSNGSSSSSQRSGVETPANLLARAL